jgi:hypothetical protein
VVTTRYVIELLVEIEVEDAGALSARAVAEQLAGDWDVPPDATAVADHFADPVQALQSIAAVLGVPRLGEACGGTILGAEVLVRQAEQDEGLPWHVASDE